MQTLSARINIKRPTHIIRHYQLEELLTLPRIDAKLSTLPRQLIKSADDIHNLPREGGVYFLATNEPIMHCMHPNILPSPLSTSYQIVYNGTASSIRERIKCHLLRTKNKGMSGIAVDILTTGEEVSSHTKVACSSSSSKKIPYSSCQTRKITPATILDDIHLSKHEKRFIRSSLKKDPYIYFQNGINVETTKHEPFNWYVYFQEIESHSVRDIVENTWRREFGMPRLCSYKEGR